MVVVEPIISLRLSARVDDNTDPAGVGNWGTLQIATPAIVGGVLILAFAVYILWHRGLLRTHSYDYQLVRSDWVTKIPRMFIPRRKRNRVYRSSDPITLDDSMRASGPVLELGRRQIRSGSSDSQTPLTQTTHPFDFDYPPENLRFSESPPPIPRQRGVRWWWLFGSRPREVRSGEPSSRWHVDGPDWSNSGHDHSTSHGHEENQVRRAKARAVASENPREEVEGSVLRIGSDFASIESTSMRNLFPEQVRTMRGLPTVPEQASSTGTHTPVPAVSAPLQSGRGTPVPSASRGFPPSYEDSQSHRGYPSEEDLLRVARSQSHMVVPPPVRAAGYSSPRAYYGRQLSSDSFLTAPMVATSMC